MDSTMATTAFADGKGGVPLQEPRSLRGLGLDALDRAICPPSGKSVLPFALRLPHLVIYAAAWSCCGSPGIALKHLLRCIPVVVFAGLAVVAAGCSDSRMAASNAVSNSGQTNGQNNSQARQSSYQVGYGLSNEGPTTDLYTELKGSLQRPERPQQTAIAAQPETPAAANGQQIAASSGGPVQQPGGLVQQSSAAVQHPAGPPREEPTATVYGMSSDGPTTDVYTELFGPRNRSAQGQ